MTDLPTPAVRNAIAYVDFFGNFAKGTQMTTRTAAQRWDLENNDYLWVKSNIELQMHSLRFYNVTDAGREVAARGSLAKSLAWLQEQGFKFNSTRNGGRTKMGFISGFEHTDGRTAWISNSQSDTSSVYVNYPRGHESYTIGSQLAFTGKAK